MDDVQSAMGLSSLDTYRLTIASRMKYLAILTMLVGIIKTICCFVVHAIEQNLGHVSIVLTGIPREAFGYALDVTGLVPSRTPT